MEMMGQHQILRMSGPSQRWNRLIITVTPTRAAQLLRLIALFEWMLEQGLREFELRFAEKEGEGKVFTKDESDTWISEERPWMELVVRPNHVVWKAYPWPGDAKRCMTSEEMPHERLLELARGVVRTPPPSSASIKPSQVATAG